jgi:tRNA nucleotidyltransferase/poly(A) polymerase
MYDTSTPIFRAACGVTGRLREAGHQAFFAGGCVRDALLGRAIKDIDIATDAHPGEVESLFPGRTVAVGKAFGVIVVRATGDLTFEVASFRADVGYADGRRPDAIRFTDAAEDARRRDFTINGLFYDPANQVILDFVDGRTDLARRVVRAIGDPTCRFEEDHLRLLRAVRFAAVLDFALDPATAAAVAACAPLLSTVSGERVGVEFTRLLCESPRPSRALDLLLELGLLQVFLPEVARFRNTPQPPEFHPEGDVWNHTCHMLDDLPAPRDPVLAYGVLLHDVGKPVTLTIQPDAATGRDRIRFPNHAVAGEPLAQAILTRLRQPTALIETVTAIVRRHMHFVDVEQMRPATLRRLMGAPTFERELDLHRLDLQHSNGDFTTHAFLVRKQAEFGAEPVLPEPWVRGRDLLALGLSEGPALGQWLQRAYDAQLEDRFTDRDQLLAWLAGELRR